MIVFNLMFSNLSENLPYLIKFVTIFFTNEWAWAISDFFTILSKVVSCRCFKTCETFYREWTNTSILRITKRNSPSIKYNTLFIRSVNFLQEKSKDMQQNAIRKAFKPFNAEFSTGLVLDFAFVNYRNIKIFFLSWTVNSIEHVG